MMNERIRQLVTEAFFDEATDVSADEMYHFGEAKMQKFAELIVRECATIALREDHDPSECILKHFGLNR